MVNALTKSIKAENARKTATPQHTRTPGRTDEVKNSAGGFVFEVSDKSRLERFLILGTDGGTYYASESKITDQNIAFLRKLIASDEKLVLDTLVDVSTNGRAYRNTPALFAIALLLTDGKDKAEVRKHFNSVVRTSTHLFEVMGYIKELGGWGRAKRDAVAGWYTGKDTDALAYQTVKYRQRNGWTHKDALRLSHAKVDPHVASFVLGKNFISDETPQAIAGFKAVQAAESAKDVVKVLKAFKTLPWETIPTQFLNEPAVWHQLFENGQLKGQALVRSITRLAKLGMFTKDPMFAAEYAAALTDEAMIEKSKLHPINFLNASVVYAEGQTDRRNGYYSGKNKDWTTEGVIADALTDGFHKAFKSVVPAGKRTLLAVDVSGSMASPAMGLELSCAQVSGAMAMTVARTEKASVIRGFTSGRGGYYGRGGSELTDLSITAKTSLNAAMQNVRKSNFGGTDCALPMTWALENDIKIDTFVVLTDSETWAGQIKPNQALVKYRKATGIDAKLAVVGIAGSPFTIADPTDRGMMDFVGADSNMPKVLADFSAGRI